MHKKLALLSMFVAPTLLSCIGPLTEVWVVVESNIPIAPANVTNMGLGQVRVHASVGGAEFWNTPYSLQDGAHALPGHFVIRPANSGESRPIELVVEGLKGDGSALVSQRALFTFARGRRTLLRVYLAAECQEPRQSECAAMGLTCGRGGMCISPDRGELPDYTPEEVSGDGGAPRADAGVDASSAFDRPIPDGGFMSADVSPPNLDAAAPPVCTPSVGTCAPGQAATTSGTGMNVPRLVRPLSGSVLSNARPTIAWELPGMPANPPGRVEFCRDRLCTQVVASFEGTSPLRPQCYLPGGTLYFRVISMSGGAYEDASPVWQLRVPHVVPNPVTVRDSAPRIDCDFDGDGFSDVAYDEGNGAGRTLKIWFGAPVGMPHQTVVGATTTGSPVCVGDLDGDGFGDIGVQTARGPVVHSGSANRMMILANSRTIPAPMPTPAGLTLAGYGDVLSAARDLNNDGYGDVLVGAPSSDLVAGTANVGAAFFVLQGPARADRNVAFIMGQGSTSNQGVGAAMSAGDAVGADELVEVVFSGPQSGGTRNGVVQFGTWTAGNRITTAGSLLLGTPGTPNLNSHFGTDVALAGDNNGDGFCDFLGSAPTLQGMQGVMIYSIGAVAWQPGRAAIFNGSVAALQVGEMGRPIGATIAQLGDFNCDGFGDLGFSRAGVATPSEVVLYTGRNAAAPRILPTPIFVDLATTVGRIIAAPGDINGDGWDDFIVSHTSGMPAMTTLKLYYGGPMFNIGTPETVVTGTINGVAAAN